MLTGQIRGSESPSAAAASARISALLCLGVVSVLSRPTSPKLLITQRVALSVYCWPSLGLGNTAGAEILEGDVWGALTVEHAVRQL